MVASLALLRMVPQQPRRQLMLYCPILTTFSVRSTVNPTLKMGHLTLDSKYLAKTPKTVNGKSGLKSIPIWLRNGSKLHSFKMTSLVVTQNFKISNQFVF